jgi:hypothetical protein
MEPGKSRKKEMESHVYGSADQQVTVTAVPQCHLAEPSVSGEGPGSPHQMPPGGDAPSYCPSAQVWLSSLLPHD